MRKRVIHCLLCLCLILSGCGNSSPIAAGNQEDFLNDMSIGICNRLNESQSVDTDSMSQEKQMEYYEKFVKLSVLETLST